MANEIVKENNAYVIRSDEGEKIAEITYSPASEDFVIADHTFVDESLRGQGIAGKLLDHLVAEMSKEGKQIKALCPYVVRKFKENPEKYDAINFDKKN